MHSKSAFGELSFSDQHRTRFPQPAHNRGILVRHKILHHRGTAGGCETLREQQIFHRDRHAVQCTHRRAIHSRLIELPRSFQRTVSQHHGIGMQPGFEFGDSRQQRLCQLPLESLDGNSGVFVVDVESERDEPFVGAHPNRSMLLELLRHRGLAGSRNSAQEYQSARCRPGPVVQDHRSTLWADGSPGPWPSGLVP